MSDGARDEEGAEGSRGRGFKGSRVQGQLEKGNRKLVHWPVSHLRFPVPCFPFPPDRLLRLLALLAAVVGAAFSGAWFQDRAAPPPSFAAVRASHQPSDVRLLDRNGEPIHERRVDKNVRRFDWVSLDQISPAVLATVLSAEDRRFYQHSGVDARALLAASVDWLAGGSRRGGSTITMQLAGMLDPSLRSSAGQRSLRQKWRQLWAARGLESTWSKAEILEAYLNLVSFRGELQGIGAATGVLFGKLAHGVSAAEACVLAALLKGPNASPPVLLQRAGVLCPACVPGELATAVRRALRARPNVAGVDLAPHLARQLLRDGEATPMLYSSIAAPLQRLAIDSLRQNLLALRDRHVADGAVLVADNASGEVLAYVGGTADLSSAVHVDAVRARRQAGSTLKPFLYGLALEQRLLTAASLLDDSPLEIRVANGLYRPQSYDGRYRGLVTVRTALAGSLNVPAVRTLELAGEEAFVQRLRELGFGGLDEAGDYYGPSLALGAADVSLWELVNAYRTLANGGAWSELRLQAVGDSLPRGHLRPRARVREAAAAVPRDLFTPAAAFVVADILADRDSRATTFGTESALATRYWTAVKTGTSKEMRDNWCIGFSRRYTVGVWVGNLNGEPMHDVSGVAGAAPVWREVMDWLHADGASGDPAPPPGVASAGAASPRREWFVTGTEPAPLRAGAPPAHIVSPLSGTLIALDPDIPDASQRVVLEARGRAAGLRWQVDGTDVGAAIPPVLWKPSPGRHSAALVDAGNTIVDAVDFVVRGRL